MAIDNVANIRKEYFLVNQLFLICSIETSTLDSVNSAEIKVGTKLFVNKMKLLYILRKVILFSDPFIQILLHVL